MEAKESTAHSCRSQEQLIFSSLQKITSGFFNQVSSSFSFKKKVGKEEEEKTGGRTECSQPARLQFCCFSKF
jgi:hypothetical protein